MEKLLLRFDYYIDSAIYEGEYDGALLTLQIFKIPEKINILTRTKQNTHYYFHYSRYYQVNHLHLSN